MYRNWTTQVGIWVIKVRNKSKSKKSESESSERKPEGTNSELFAHMNRENLNYIKAQIEAKTKKQKYQQKVQSAQEVREPEDVAPSNLQEE